MKNCFCFLLGSQKSQGASQDNLVNFLNETAVKQLKYLKESQEEIGEKNDMIHRNITLQITGQYYFNE